MDKLTKPLRDTRTADTCEATPLNFASTYYTRPISSHASNGTIGYVVREKTSQPIQRLTRPCNRVALFHGYRWASEMEQTWPSTTRNST